MSATALRPGDVVRYDPGSYWSHDGYAIARERGGEVVLIDTYWISGGSRVDPDEYTVLLNLDDYDETPAAAWETFTEADRKYIPRHSGYQPLRLVRKGAVPDRPTQIANARERIIEAEQAVRSAESNLAWRRTELTRLAASLGVSA